MKNVVVVLAAAVILASAGVEAQRGFALNGVPLVPVESQIVKGQPYSAEIASESVQTLADGNRIIRKTTGRVYRDGEGRTRREEDRASGSPSISITDVVAGQSFLLNVDQRSATATNVRSLNWVVGGPAEAPGSNVAVLRVAPPPPPPPPPPPGDAAASLVVLSNKLAELQLAEQKKLEAAAAGGTLQAVRGGRGGANTSEETIEERLQDRVMGGVLATGTRRTTTIAAGAIGNVQPIKIVSEEWFSPDLQILVQTEHTDPRFGRSTYQVVNIGRNEPDPSLFQIPADYTIRRPGGGGARGGRQ